MEQLTYKCHQENLKRLRLTRAVSLILVGILLWLITMMLIPCVSSASKDTVNSQTQFIHKNNVDVNFKISQFDKTPQKVNSADKLTPWWITKRILLTLFIGIIGLIFFIICEKYSIEILAPLGILSLCLAFMVGRYYIQEYQETCYETPFEVDQRNWNLAKRINTPKAYFTYLNLYEDKRELVLEQIQNLTEKKKINIIIQYPDKLGKELEKDIPHWYLKLKLLLMRWSLVSGIENITVKLDMDGHRLGANYYQPTIFNKDVIKKDTEFIETGAILFGEISVINKYNNVVLISKKFEKRVEPVESYHYEYNSRSRKVTTSTFPEHVFLVPYNEMSSVCAKLLVDVQKKEAKGDKGSI